MSQKLHVRTGDTVVVIAGKEKGKQSGKTKETKDSSQDDEQV